MSLEGILILDKPPGMSSARAVSAVKRLLPRGTKIGHAGTLDPFATGVLLLLIGKATKACERLMDSAKQYDATIRFGATTATDDPESPAEPWTPRSGEGSPPMQDAVREKLAAMVGVIQQQPPAFSALKIGGRRAYDLARKGAEVKLAPRPVRIYGIDLLSYEWPDLRLRIDCGRGTYIRSIARELGEKLDVGGHLTQLRRTAIGEYRIENASTLEQVREADMATLLRPVPPPLPSTSPGSDKQPSPI